MIWPQNIKGKITSFSQFPYKLKVSFRNQSSKFILNKMNHPFLVGMDYVFQKAYRIYFVMDYVEGGELFKHLSDLR